MAVRSKDDAQALREPARTMFFSSATVDELLACASAAQARAVRSFIEVEQRNRAMSERAKLMRKAKSPAIMGLDGYGFSNVAFPEGCTERGMRSLRFTDRRQGFAFHGPTGRGKTRPATAIGLSAVDSGREARFFNVASLVLHMVKLKAEGELGPFMNEPEKPSPVILDEFGYVPLDIGGARPLYQVVSKRHEKRSVVIATNMEFGKRGAVLGDDKMAAAPVDRLVYHGRMVEFTGAGRRMGNALMLGKQGEEDARQSSRRASPVRIRRRGQRKPMPECRHATCQCVEKSLAKDRRRDAR